MCLLFAVFWLVRVGCVAAVVCVSGLWLLFWVFGYCVGGVWVYVSFGFCVVVDCYLVCWVVCVYV